MALIIRIDVDRPYGRQGHARHFLSRISSDLYFPKIAACGYLAELNTMLNWLNESGARSYVFFRRCTLPSASILKLIESGRHEIGLHLENSRSFNTFRTEIEFLERNVNKQVKAFSKHGSGATKYGLFHYAPYEPDRYLSWAQCISMRLFLGNLEDPNLESATVGDSLIFFPSAFWLEPHWRDTRKFPLDWLIERARHQDVVLLVHPENVLANKGLTADFKKVIGTLPSKVFA